MSVFFSFLRMESRHCKRKTLKNNTIILLGVQKSFGGQSIKYFSQMACKCISDFQVTCQLVQNFQAFFCQKQNWKHLSDLQLFISFWHSLLIHSTIIRFSFSSKRMCAVQDHSSLEGIQCGSYREGLSRPLRMGALKGNHFQVAIRNIQSDTSNRSV